MKRGLPPANAIISEKTQACLEIAEACHNKENGYAKWSALYEAACAKYSEKAVNRKMEELSERDYIDYGVSVRTGWLTERGKAVLRLCRFQAGLRMPVPLADYESRAAVPVEQSQRSTPGKL